MELKSSDLLVYDESSPSFLRWKSDRRRGFGDGYVFIEAGTPVGCVNKKTGYYMTKLPCNTKETLVHREVWQLWYGKIPEGLTVDHINGNILDNSIGNLRLVPHAVNMRNRPKRSDNKSGKTGVTDFAVEARFRVYWVSSGKLKSQTFSYKRSQNKQEAFEAACKFRDEMINIENTAGAGYTPRHGT